MYVNKNNRRESALSIKDSYLHYRAMSEKPLPKVEYVALMGLFMLYIAKLIMEGFQVKLPEIMGMMYLKGKKTRAWIDKDGKVRGVSIDFKATNEFRRANPGSKEIIYHFNEHTGGIGYAFFWCKRKMHAENKELYHFTPARGNKRQSAKVIRKNKIEYEMNEFAGYPSHKTDNRVGT